jgi:hypothetical protein
MAELVGAGTKIVALGQIGQVLGDSSNDSFAVERVAIIVLLLAIRLLRRLFR